MSKQPPDREPLYFALLCGFVLLAAVGVFCWATSMARADDSPSYEDTVLVLVSVGVGEADWATAEHLAIYGVLQRRADAQGVDVSVMAKRYSAVWAGKPSARARWVRELEPSCAEPPSWPAKWKWSQYRERCHRAFGNARAWLKGETRDPCPPSAVHFGARTGVDHANATRNGWRLVSCSMPTSNLFWSVPRGERG